METAVSPAFRRILFSAEKVQRNIRLIANNPAIVWHRRNVKEFACFQLDHATVIKCNCSRSRENEPDMFNRTACCADTRSDMFAPLPPRFVRRTTNCDSAEVNQLEFPFFHHTHFIRRIEGLQNDRYLFVVHRHSTSKACVKSKATVGMSLRSFMEDRYAKRINNTSEITANTIPITSK